MIIKWLAERTIREPAPTELPPEETLLAAATTEIGPSALSSLVVVDGPPEMIGARFALRSEGVSIGREGRCDVRIDDRSVSRLHAEVRLHGNRWVLLHRSRTNRTTVNGQPVGSELSLYHGDEIRVAGRVTLRMDAAAHPRRVGESSGPLRTLLEERSRVDEESVARRFVREGTFLDVDVVDSYGMKTGDVALRDVVVSFGRFRDYVTRCIQECGGQVLNCNGDEVMAFFGDADNAVDAAAAVQSGLDHFHNTENRLARPFQVRMGAHSGRAAIDFDAGIAYSTLLDLAGHLQKAAEPGGLMISRETRDALTRPRDLTEHTQVGKGTVTAYSVRL